MLTLNSGEAQDLTQKELILHHYAAMLKKDLDAYHANSQSQKDWMHIFKSHLACVILLIHIYKQF